MTTIRIDVTSHVEAVKATARSAAGVAIAKAAHDIEAHAKRIVTEKDIIDTGLLKSSIQAHKDPSAPFRWSVESPVDYSVYQEFGTRHMPARPYMLPALERVRPSLIAALQRLV